MDSSRIEELRDEAMSFTNSAHCRAMLDELLDEVESLQGLADERHALVVRQADLLTGVAKALKGEPPELIWWSHHDLPEIAAEAMDVVRKACDFVDAPDSCAEAWHTANDNLHESVSVYRAAQERRESE